ncbi:MAG TPA: hydrogenase small subunit [Candidatus Limnocylindrales bacterium]|nr:hydrogenase small subunit [Candidatus Limnocylindrales bacterium]
MARQDGLYAALLERGVTRRDFLKFSAAMSAALALPAGYAPRIAAAVTSAPRVPVIWLEGQDCAGNTEAFLRASHPTVAELVLDTLSVDYHETIMAAAGQQAEAARLATMKAFPHGYIAVVEGSVPVADGGVYCTIGGKAFSATVREVCDGALATIAVGSCAFDGGLPAAAGGTTGAIGAGQAVPGAKIINLPGCPMNVQNLTATIVHFLTFKQWPATDVLDRPLFAYGQLIHDQCERRAHFERGEYVQAWGDDASRKGWCLYQMGCKGPETFANCPTARFNDGTSWPVKAGHGCVGCTMPNFWDQMSPFYRRLPTVGPFATDVTADQVGLGLVGVVTALTAVHAAGSAVRKRRTEARVRAELAAVSAPVTAGTTPQSTPPDEQTEKDGQA